MIKASELAYSLGDVQQVWAVDKQRATSMALRNSALVAIETLQRENVRSSEACPEPSDQGEAANARAISEWVTTAVCNHPRPQSPGGPKRVKEAAQHLAWIAELHELLAKATTREAREAMAEAIMLGTLIGGYAWRSAPHRPRGSSPFSLEQLEEILQRMVAGQAGVAAAKDVLGEVKVGAKNRYDSAVKAARKLQKDRAHKSQT